MTDAGSVTLSVRTWAEIAMAAIIAVLCGFLWYSWGQNQPIKETASPAARQDDSSLVLPREPTGPITKTKKPAQKIPKAAKVERIIQVTVEPDQPPAGQPCPPVTVDMTLVREPDGGRRMITSSPDGQILSGMDIPIETPTPAIDHPWAAGISLYPIQQTMGVWVDRNLRRLRIGVEIQQVKSDIGSSGIEGRVRLGVTF